MVVSIPFGNGNHERRGYVIGLSQEPKLDSAKIKPFKKICSSEETTEEKLIALAAWMKERYGSTMAQALKTVLPVREKVKSKEKRYVLLNIDKEEALTLAQNLEKGRCKARARLLRALCEQPKLDYTRASKELGMTTAVITPLVEQGLVHIQQDEIYRIPIEEGSIPREKLSDLTEAQQKVGKTQVYMKLIEQVTAEGKQVIVLIPEISLTYQTVRRFYGWFGDKVSVLNSRLSMGERYDQFRRAKLGEIQIMVGPRSALFTPFSNLGLIIIDEEHEQTYKSENSPRYHAREVAVQRAVQEGAHVVLGSATPSLEAYSRAVSGEYLLTKLTARFENRPLPEVSVVDLREELKAGNRSILSRKLKDSIEKRLRNN